MHEPEVTTITNDSVSLLEVGVEIIKDPELRDIILEDFEETVANITTVLEEEAEEDMDVLNGIFEGGNCDYYCI